MKGVLVAIGGMDPTAHAGLVADTRVFEHYRLPYRCVTTAVTAQRDRKFLSSEPVSIKIFRKQLDSIPEGVFGVKIGMLGTTRFLAPLLDWFKRKKPKHILWDPVIRSSSGGKLLSEIKWNRALQGLLERCTLLTPNLPEAEWILGKTIKNLTEVGWAAQSLYRQGKGSGRAILIKGGHLKLKRDQVLDIFFDGKSLVGIGGKKIPRERRGTGCTLASAILSHLALGKSPLAATRAARRYLINHWFKVE